MTFTISISSLIVAAVLLVIAVVSPLVSAWFRKALPNDKKECELQTITILLTPHNDAEHLARTLPVLLNQEYEAGLRIVAVYWKGDTEVENVLKQNADNPKLYYTYIPESSRYMSREKLAVTVGVKAADTEWIVLLPSYCCPSSDQWLKSFIANAGEDNNMVLGCTSLSADAPIIRRYHHALLNRYFLRTANNGQAVSTVSPLLAFRKSEFVKEEGFRGNLEFSRGEYEYIVNKYARTGSVAIASAEDSWIEEATMSAKQWQTRRLFAMNTFRQLHRYSGIKMLRIVDSLALHLPLLAFIVAIIVGFILTNWLISGAAILALVLNYILRAVFGIKGARQMHFDIPAWQMPFLEIADSWSSLIWGFRYLRANKMDFITHKL